MVILLARWPVRLPREIDPLITIIALCHDAIIAVAQVAGGLTQLGVHSMNMHIHSSLLKMSFELSKFVKF